MLARPLLEVRRGRTTARLGVGLERVLLAGVLCACLWRPVGRSGGVWAGSRSENSRRASALSRRHATSLFLSRSLERFRRMSGLWQPWRVLRALAATGDKKASF